MIDLPRVLDLPTGARVLEVGCGPGRFWERAADRLPADLDILLTDLGLPAALEELADQSPIQVAVNAQLDGRLPGHVENTAYFAAAEALTNIAKHSDATSATVTARLHGGVLTLEVSDNGHGGANPSRGTGLTGLADRVAVADGRMLLSSPPGGPTILRVEVPCPQSTP